MSVGLGSSAGVSLYQFAGNGCFDPDITGTGHQPYYWDTYTGVYNYYSVMGSRV
jgi:hypothetical protein